MNLKTQIAVLSVNTAKACITLKAAMSEDSMRAIREGLDKTKRRWNDRDAVWEIHPSAINDLKPILKALYADVQMLGVPKALPATKFDQLMAKLDSSDKAAIYRLLAAKYHPDKGGSHETMTLINIVFKEGGSK